MIRAGRRVDTYPWDVETDNDVPRTLGHAIPDAGLSLPFFEQWGCRIQSEAAWNARLAVCSEREFK